MLYFSVIPKIIHYCWFGPNEKNERIKSCINSWEKFLPDFQIMEWNERNFDIKSTQFTFSAYQTNYYSFVSDYVRAYALYNFGGIYLDTDVEVKQNLSPFLKHSAFSGFEGENYPFTAVWGSTKKHLWPKKVLESYVGREFIPGVSLSNTKTVSDLLVSDFGIDRNLNKFQMGSEGVVIYPSTTFCLDLPANFTTHHFVSSWGKENEKNYKYFANQFWREKNFASQVSEDDLGHALRRLIGEIGFKKTFIALLKLSPRIFVKLFTLISKK